MNKKHVLILWIIAACLGAAVAAVKVAQNKGPDDVTKYARGERLFQEIPVGELTSIKVQDADSTATIEKSENGWVVKERGDYPANIPMLAGLLDKFNEVKVGQGLQAGPSFDSRFGMDAESSAPEDHGLQLTLAAGDKDPWTISLGKTANGTADMANPMAPAAGGGRYIRLGSDPESVYVVEETFPRVTADPKDWLSEDFLQVSKIESITLRAPGDPDFEPWQLTREDASAEFTMEGLGENEELLSTPVSPLKSLFSFARFEDVLTPEQAVASRDESQARQAIIKTFDGFTYTVEVAPKEADPAEETEEGQPAPTPNYLMSFKVSAEFPAARTPAEDETEEQKTAADEAFKTGQEALKQKLIKEQNLEDRVFEVTKWTVDSLLKSRADLVGPKATEPTVPEPAPAPKLEDTFGFPEQ